jgi:predicted ester cyclase
MKQEERAMTKEQRDMELMQTLDDAWNSQDWDTFDKRHQNDVVVRRPGQPPTHGRHDHRAEGILMFKTFPDNRVENRPYKVFFASGDWTCSIARFTGTMKGPMIGPNSVEIPPTGKSISERRPGFAGKEARANKLLEPTAYIVRSCVAPAIGRGSLWA